MRVAAILIGLAAALPMAASADVYVDGHYRSDGTYVPGHYRSSPDSSRLNNWSTRGNVNPYTGERGTKPLFEQPNYNRNRNSGYNNDNSDSGYGW